MLEDKDEMIVLYASKGMEYFDEFVLDKIKGKDSDSLVKKIQVLSCD